MERNRLSTPSSAPHERPGAPAPNSQADGPTRHADTGTNTARSSTPVANRIDAEDGWCVPAPIRHRWCVLEVAGGLTRVGVTRGWPSRGTSAAPSGHNGNRRSTGAGPACATAPVMEMLDERCVQDRWCRRCRAPRRFAVWPALSWLPHIFSGSSAVHRAGVPLLAGTVAGALGRYTPPAAGRAVAPMPSDSPSRGEGRGSSGIVQYADARGPQPIRAADLQPHRVRCGAARY